jgi:alkylation response protein AidB-like acyl-CoA dehydrogenase
MLIARTDPEQPKHQGITWFSMDMHQSEVDVRPLVEMTGHALFNEVFLSDAHVGNDAIIGGRGNGWAVANTTLMHERSGLGSGGGSAGGGAATPGTIGGFLSKRAGDFASAPRKKRSASSGASASPLGGGGAKLMIDLAKGNGAIQDPTIRQDLMKLHTLGELGKFNNLRLKAAKKAGQDIPGFGNLSKLAMSDIMRLTRDIGLRIIGPAGMLHAYRDEDRAANDEATGNPFGQIVTSMALWAQAPPIYGGTDQIQKNIIGERVLGLGKEPGDTKSVPFSELPKNA